MTRGLFAKATWAAVLSTFLLFAFDGTCLAADETAAAPVAAAPKAGADAAPAKSSAGSEGDTSAIEAKLDMTIPPLTMTNTKWREFFTVLAKQTGISFMPSAKVTGNVDVSFPQKMTLRQILDEFLPMNGLNYDITPTAIKIITEGEKLVAPDVLISKTFTVQYTTVDKLKNAIQSMKSPGGQIVADPSTKQIIVTDTAENLSEIEAMISKLDIETEKRIFKLRYADIDTVLKQIKDIMSGEKGSIQDDPKTGTLIITDIPENLQRIADIIKELDVKTDLTVIQVNFADPKDAIKLAKEFLSKDAFIEYDERTNQIIIDDIPSRVEKVRALLKKLDEPEKVVYIEAEIVDLSLKSDVDIGLDWQIGKSVDVKSASDLLMLKPLLNIASGKGSMSYLVPQNYKATLSAMESKGQAKVLASPRVLVKNNEGAKLQVGTEEPYSVRSSNSNYYGGGGYNSGYNNNNNNDYYGGGGGMDYTQRSKDVGIILDVEVKINHSGYVEMDIKLTNSSAELVNLSGVENSGLRVRKSEVTTITPVKDGRTVVIGGLIEESRNHSVGGLPWLARVPIVGWLFGKLKDTHDKHKLLLFLTPHIVSIDDPYRQTELGEKDKKTDSLDLLPVDEPVTETPFEDLTQEFPVEAKTTEAVETATSSQMGTTATENAAATIMDATEVPEVRAQENITPPKAPTTKTPKVAPANAPAPEEGMAETLPPKPVIDNNKQLDLLNKDLERIDRARKH